MYNRSTGQRKTAERGQDSDKPEKITIIDHYIALLLVVLIDGGLIEVGNDQLLNFILNKHQGSYCYS